MSPLLFSCVNFAMYKMNGCKILLVFNVGGFFFSRIEA